MLIPVSLICAEIRGRVVDRQDGIPVQSASVYLNHQWQALTEVDGTFTIPSISTRTYELTVHRIGYAGFNTRLTVTNQPSLPLEILLEPQPILLEPLTVTPSPAKPGLNAIEIDRQFIEQSGCQWLPDLLEQLPGITVHRANREGISKVLLSGPGADRVSIWLDGIKLNDPATGGYDLSGISLSAINSISIVPGGESGDQPGGAILLRSRSFQKTRLSLGTGLGSYGYSYHKFFVETEQPLNTPVSLWLDIKHKYYQGNYPVEGYATNCLYNNNSESYQFNGKLNWGNQYRNLSLFAQFFIRNRGLPGLANGGIMSETRYNQENKLVNLSAKLLESAYGNEFSLSWQENYGEYLSPEFQKIPYQEEFLKYYPEQLITVSTRYSFFNQFNFFALDYLTFFAKIQWDKEIFSQEDRLRPFLKIDDISRVIYSPQAGWSIKFPWSIYQLDLSGQVSLHRWEQQNTVGQFFGSSAGINFITSYDHSKIILGCSWVKNARIPNFQETYTVETVYSLGNPDLKAEQAETFRLIGKAMGGEIYPWEFSMSWWRSLMWNRIVWRRDFRGRYKPYNLGKSLGWGVDFGGGLSFPHNLSVQGNIAIQDVRNKTPYDVNYDNFLTYRPVYRCMLSLNQSIDKFSYGATVKGVGRQYTLESNNDPINLSNISLPPYQTLCLKLTYQNRWKTLDYKILFQIDNVLGEKYSVIQQMPTEGRTITVEVELTWPKN
ncbi:MAG: hypothetical protein APR63_09405 [Desulfuromonas sp. SDB]|nr:MAG: hypothetical protein APR63_09405 [Desulfuromonas sp. SDB]